MNLKPLKTAGIVSLVMGILFVLTGGIVWGVVTSQLAAERITVPDDAAFMQGATVADPLSALAQADIINHHAMEGSEGRTYAELGSLAREARAAGDTELADELTAQRMSVMNASFLRASLFTSVLSYGVCLFAIGVGLSLIVLGWALTSVARQTVPGTVASARE